MGKLKFIVAGLILACLAGACSTGESRIEYNVNYCLINGSGVDIVMIYKERNSLETDTVKIASGSRYEFVRVKLGRFPAPFDANSMTVIFNRERSIEYQRRSDEDQFNNPLVFSSYIDEDIDQDNHVVYSRSEYTFVPEQYDLAEPLENVD